MNKEEIFAAWAPETSVWSRWVKPVLFAYLDIAAPAAPTHETPEATASLPAPIQTATPAGLPALPITFPLTNTAPEQPPGTPVPETAWETSWAPAIETRCALVLDLPCAEGVILGLELTARGYRPVPLYNAVPLPSGEPLADPLTGRPVAAVHVLPILYALKKGAAILGLADLPPDAPPAFLLDAHRRGEGREMLPDEFDNRSVCFTTDFPSANFLSAQRINCVVLVQHRAGQPQLDLAHVLRRWQQSGVPIRLKRLGAPGPPVPCEIGRPSWFGAMFQRALSMTGFRRGEAGGFGAWVTDTSAGG